MLTTLRIYSHLWAEAEEKTRSVLDEARAKARAARPAESSQPGGRIPESRRSTGALTVVSP